MVKLAARGPHAAQGHLQREPKNYFLICCYLLQANLFNLLRRIRKNRDSYLDCCLCARAAHTINFETLLQNASFPCERCVR